MRRIAAQPPARSRRALHGLAGVRLTVDSDDAGLHEELQAVLGRVEPGLGPRAIALRAVVRATEDAAFGHLRLQTDDPELLSPADFLLGFSSPDFPFERLEGSGSWTSVAFRGEQSPQFGLRGDDCLFALAAGWRKAVALFLLWRLMRARRDALFFHAASVGVRGRGVLVVGPKGAGKSTLALALASRGHDLLGDEQACYVPARGELIPFRRPVGVKPGPRARAVDEALRAIDRIPERDGMMRVELPDLLRGPGPAPVPLRAVLFLRGFAPRARFERLSPGREELARLQPVGACLVNAPATERVFAMARLLSRTAVYALWPGDPDETAECVEREAVAS
ncbi:MAG TPA: hypothetical protein VFM88_18310 [Vicinamibacteria bacterium]|nr:hypothetical protein [Vicinamibacteria bacterium]